MRRPTLLILFQTIFFGTVLAACSGDQKILPLYGVPSPIPQDQSPLDVICTIQTEFRQLPKPLMVRQSYQASWTTDHLGAAPVEHRGYVRIHLRDEALTFLQHHSRLELVASLTPLFNDPELGGEVAVLLAGIPVGSKSDQGQFTGSLANRIDQLAYSSPKNPGRWFLNDSFKYYYANRLYGLINSSDRLHQQTISSIKGTLEEELTTVLQAFSRLPASPIAEGQLNVVPQPHNSETVDAWIKAREQPTPNIKAQEFIDKTRGDFGAITLLPLMLEPSPYLGRTESYVMWLLNLEGAFWPAAIQLPRSDLQPAQLRHTFRQAVIEKLSRVCESE